MAVTFAQAGGLVQHQTRVLDRGRENVGVVAQIYVDDETNQPLWAAVVIDPPSAVETVVPVDDAVVDDGDLVVSYSRSVIESGPRICADDELPWEKEERLRDHYGPHAAQASAIRRSSR